MNITNIQSSNISEANFTHPFQNISTEQVINQEKTYKRKFEEIINTQNAEKDVKKSKNYFLSLDLSHPTIGKTVQTTADLWEKLTTFTKMNDLPGINIKDQGRKFELSKEEMTIIVQNELSIPINQLVSGAKFNQTIKFSEGEMVISFIEKQLLIKHSPYFTNLWTSGFLESQPQSTLFLEDIPKDHFEFLLNFLKNPNKSEDFINLDLNKEELFALLQTAHYLSIEKVIKPIDKTLDPEMTTEINDWPYQEEFLQKCSQHLDFANTYHLDLMKKNLEKYLNNYLIKDLKEDKQRFRSHMQNFYKHLTKVDLSSCVDLKDEDLIKECTHLKTLDLCNGNITEKGLQVLPYLKSLKSLNLTDANLNEKDDVWFDVFKDLKNLKTLLLSYVSIKSTGRGVYRILCK